MTDTLWADISEFNRPVDDTYPYRVLSLRSNDGTYWDKVFDQNYAWAKSAVDRGRLDFFIVYFVYWPNWQDGVATLKQRVGVPHPRMVVMIDVETWSGKITGNQSAGINAAREDLIAWLGGNRRRVIGYGNCGDLNTLWPDRGDTQLVIAGYGSNPSYPGKIAHQYTDRGPCPPFGTCDMNSADGYDVPALMTALGLLEDDLLSALDEPISFDGLDPKDPLFGKTTTLREFVAWSAYENRQRDAQFNNLGSYVNTLGAALKAELAALQIAGVTQDALNTAAQNAVTAASALFAKQQLAALAAALQKGVQ